METDLHLLIAGGMAALGGAALGLLLGILRGQTTSDRVRREHGEINSQTKIELAAARTHIRGLEVEQGQARTQQRDQLRHLTELRQELAQGNRDFNNLQNDYIRLQTEHRERQHQHAEKVQLLNETRDNLKREFESLANRIFEDKGKSFAHSSRESLEALLQPFREQISGFQSRINEVHSESVRGNTALEKEIQKVLEVGLEMNSQATNLTSALKGDKKTTGNWGEAQLQRTLELAGLQAGEHYEAQAAFKDDQGKRKLPDFVIKLPDGKSLVIDSKVSLVDYDRATSAATEEHRNEALNAHARAVRSHIEDLSAKDYVNLPGIGSPDFVLMFMPIEPAYIEAMRHTMGLFNYGYNKGVIIVSHTTLMPILRTISNLWMIEQSNAEAREISSRAGDIYNQVCLVAERLHKLGNTLKAANNHYNDAVRGLSGQQGLYGKVERFQQVSTRANRAMVTLEPIHSDIESDRVEGVVDGVVEGVAESEAKETRSEPTTIRSSDQDGQRVNFKPLS